MSDHLLRCRFSSAPLDASGSEPKWNLVVPLGTFHGKTYQTLAPLGGKFDFTKAWFEELIANWRAAGSFRVPVRWTHAHARNDKPELERDLDRKAASLVDLRVTDRGLEGLAAWSEAGRKDVESGEVDGWSAEISFRHENRLTGAIGTQILTGVALTNDPFFNTMPPLAADATPTPSDSPAAKDTTMNEEQKKLRAQYGLAETATDAEVLAAATKQGTEIAKLKADSKPVGLSAADVKIAADAAAEAALAPVKLQLKAAEEKALSLEVDALIATAKAGDGKMGRAIVTDKVKPTLLKLIASESKREDGMKAAKDFLDVIPLTVPVTAIGTTGSVETGLNMEAAKVAYETELDTLIKAGNSVVAANKQIRAGGKHTAYLAASTASLSTNAQKS